MSTSVAPSLTNCVERGAHGLFDVGRQAFAEVFLRHADAQAGQRLVQVAREVFAHVALFRRQAGRVALVEADHFIEQQRAVFGGLRDRAALVERGGERDHAEARHAAVGRLDAGDAAERGRLADRAAGVGGGGRRRQARGDRRGRAARGAARHRQLVPRVLHRAEGRVLVRRAHREFVAIELAERDHAGLRRSCSTTVASNGLV